MRPGYELCPFVEQFLDTPVGPVPQARVRLDPGDRLGTVLARFGLNRSRYKVAPGLWAVGRPGPESPVLVTANYKLTFDALRKELAETDAWLLVLDTKGVNVWCAAGKGAFGTEELVGRVHAVRLAGLVAHRELILPQYGATGVSAHEVARACGFKVLWGPIRAADLPAYLRNGKRAEPAMRQATFNLPERLVLVPVELMLLRRQLLWLIPLLFVLSGVGPGVFSLGGAWSRGLPALWSTGAGIFAGAVLTPLLLPVLPGRAFAVKGALAGLVCHLLLLPWLWGRSGGGGLLGLALWTVAASSWMAMNFTGSTPFTSPSGVEKEMRWAMPAQAVLALTAAALWVASAWS